MFRYCYDCVWEVPIQIHSNFCDFGGLNIFILYDVSLTQDMDFIFTIYTFKNVRYHTENDTKIEDMFPPFWQSEQTLTTLSQLKVLCLAVFVTKLGHYWETKVQLWRLAPSIVFSCGTACPSAQIMLLSYRAWQIPKQDSKTLKPLARLLLTAEFILNVNTYFIAITHHSEHWHREQEHAAGL